MSKEREYKKALLNLTAELNRGLRQIDVEMTKHESPERGKNIALISNNLDMALDSALHFTLGWSFDRIKKYKSLKAPKP